jgi:undecaprenol kinase
MEAGVKHNHSLIKSFSFAFAGVSAAFKKGRNFRIQLTIGALAVFLALIFNVTSAEWITLTIIIALVLVLELINTAIEYIVDLVSPEIRPEAKIIKDVSAGAVLLAAIASVFIGLFIFLPKII